MKQELIVLIVEDDENDVYFLKKGLVLEGMGDQIQIVSNAFEAVQYLQGDGQFFDREQFPFPSLIFADLKTPRRDGFDLLEWLRNHPECSVIPVIVFSGSKKDADIRKAYEMGANAYMAKTANFDNLRAMLKATAKFWALCEKPHVPYKC